MFHSSESFPDPAKKIIQQGLRDYVSAVYNDEVKRMARGNIDFLSGGAHANLRILFSQMDASALPNRELYAESLRTLNNLAQYRRLRIFAGNDTNPPVIWFVLLVGGLFTISFAYFFGMKNIKAQYVITTTLTVTITLILFLIYVLDHPFTGTSMSLDPLRQAIAIMQKGDRFSLDSSNLRKF